MLRTKLVNQNEFTIMDDLLGLNGVGRAKLSFCPSDWVTRMLSSSEFVSEKSSFRSRMDWPMNAEIIADNKAA